MISRIRAAARLPWQLLTAPTTAAKIQAVRDRCKYQHTYTHGADLPDALWWQWVTSHYDRTLTCLCGQRITLTAYPKPDPGDAA